jgi:hypothetical protein
VSPARVAFVSCAIACAWVLTGCPPDLQPPLSDGGRACATSADCNAAGVTCGALALCIQQVCEATPSLIVPCR